MDHICTSEGAVETQEIARGILTWGLVPSLVWQPSFTFISTEKSACLIRLVEKHSRNIVIKTNKISGAAI